MSEDKIIRYIREGIVIDHLPPGMAWKVAEILGLDKQNEGRISLGDHHRSGKLGGEKSFLKIEGRTLSSYEMSLIALVAPNATLNVIKEGLVYEKKNVKLPDLLKGILQCPNINCISNQEKEKIIAEIYCKGEKFICHYCGQSFSREDFNI
jgi:aspartate carbamoyltransferase regulatory subunit